MPDGRRSLAERLLRRGRILPWRFGRLLTSLLQRASLYRFTDDALLLSAAIVGLVVGLAIVVFHLVLEGFDHVLATLAPRSVDVTSWTALLVPLITAAGGLSVGFLKHFVFRDVTHHGLHSVSASFRDAERPMTWRHAAHAVLLSSLSIATGGGAGRESPTVVLGASLAATFGNLGRMDRRHIRVLGAAGAAAAISGIFNAPLGGILFAVEAITGELRARTFVPIVVASVLATTAVRTILGNHPLLIAPVAAPLQLLDYPLLAVAGVASAGVAAFYLRAFGWAQRHTVALLASVHGIVRPAIGGFAVGLPLMVLPALLETTYQPVNEAIAGQGLWWMALATIVLKPVTNAVTLASGGEGGTFAPALKTGALFGFCLGSALHMVIPTVSPGLFALVCAGAVIAGTFRAPLTGAILLFEVSSNYGMLLPLLFSAVFSVYAMRKLGIPTFNPIADVDQTSAPDEQRSPALP